MGRVSIYLNYQGKTEEAFNFYKGIFGTEYTGLFMRMKEVPTAPGMPPLQDEDKEKIMHVELPILGGAILMGTDISESMGQEISFGNNISINLEPDTKAETEGLFQALAEGGQVSNDLTDMFWGGYFGSLTDKYGVRWMFNCAAV